MRRHLSLKELERLVVALEVELLTLYPDNLRRSPENASDKTGLSFTSIHPEVEILTEAGERLEGCCSSRILQSIKSQLACLTRLDKC
jgi:hypothetical protein